MSGIGSNSSAAKSPVACSEISALGELYGGPAVAAVLLPPAPRGAYRHWSEADDRRLEELLELGHGIAGSALLLGRSEGALAQRIRARALAVRSGRSLTADQALLAEQGQPVAAAVRYLAELGASIAWLPDDMVRIDGWRMTLAGALTVARERGWPGAGR